MERYVVIHWPSTKIHLFWCMNQLNTGPHKRKHVTRVHKLEQDLTFGNFLCGKVLNNAAYYYLLSSMWYL